MSPVPFQGRLTGRQDNEGRIRGRGLLWVFFTREPVTVRVPLSSVEDDFYAVREPTTKELRKIGFMTEDELRRAMQDSPAAEVRIRTRAIRQELLSKPRGLTGAHGPS